MVERMRGPNRGVSASATLLGYRVLIGLVRYLPRRIAYALARWAGAGFARLPTVRRAAIRLNLSVALRLPPSDPAVERAARGALTHWFLNFVDLFRVGHPRFPAMIRRAPVAGWDLFNTAFAQGRGVVIVSAHIGPYETIVQRLVLRGVPVMIPVERIDPPELLDFLAGSRGRLGLRVEPIGLDTFRVMSAMLKQGGVVVVVCDRDVRGTGEPAELFGHPVKLPSAGLLLALRTGAPLIGAFAHRDRHGTITGRFTPPFTFGLDPATRTGGKLAAAALRPALAHGIGELAALFEREISRDPSQWVVLQPVFDGPFAGKPATANSSRVDEAIREPA